MNKKADLHIFEAIELRNEYDRHIKLLEKLLRIHEEKGDRLFSSAREEERVPATGFDLKKTQELLKKLQTKRVKLNQAIQEANFKSSLIHQSGSITTHEALEVRKNMLADLALLSERVFDAAYKRIIHKEERDITRTSAYSFSLVYDEYKKKLKELRQLQKEIHLINHKTTVPFKDE